MVSDLQGIFSVNAKGMQKSVIRELLKLTLKPEIISFAGGLPDPKAFPTDEVAGVTADVLKRDGATVLQYGPTEGDPRLKAQIIAHHEQQDGIKLRPENVLITVGSQQGLDLVARIFVDIGDVVLVGLPSYVGGLQAFQGYGARMVGVPLDDEGTRVDLVERELEKLRKAVKKPKFIYEVPDFQNPAGITMTEERRLKLLDLARRYDVLILEDSPYRELRYAVEPVKPIYRLDGNSQVIGLYTFSKILFPGMRLGWVIADEAIIQKLVTAMQAADLCPPSFNQAIVAEFAARGLLDKNIARVKAIYREKRELMLKSLDQYMPRLPGLRWTKPDGGLFLLVVLPEHMDTDEMFYEAIEQNVAYVVGSAFHSDGGGRNAMRLNFSYPTKDEIVEGVRRLAKVIEDYDRVKARSRQQIASP